VAGALVLGNPQARRLADAVLHDNAVAQSRLREPEEKAWANVGKAYHARILEGREAFNERFCVKLEKHAIEGLCVTIDDIKKRIDEFTARFPSARRRRTSSRSSWSWSPTRRFGKSASAATTKRTAASASSLMT
jgi:hypothetical protein